MTCGGIEGGTSQRWRVRTVGRRRREQAEPTGWFGLGGWRKKKTRDVRIPICHGHVVFPMKNYSPFDVLVQNKFVGAGGG